jgi:hypothetical protein
MSIGHLLSRNSAAARDMDDLSRIVDQDFGTGVLVVLFIFSPPPSSQHHPNAILHNSTTETSRLHKPLLNSTRA